jgi:hypothetical protein
MKAIQVILLVFLSLVIQVQASHASDREMKEWTFLVFMNGHDEALDQFTDTNLALMEKVGTTQDVNVVVQVASLSREETERVLVKKGGHTIVESMPRVDMGDYKELNKFIKWTVENYPAKKYFIDVWNHGAGWHAVELKNLNALNGPNDFHKQDVSFDSLTKNYITTEEMGKVMKSFAKLIGHKVDIYGNDACLMSMIEIVAEFSDAVSFFSSSQENEPLSGWPYDKMLARLTANPTMEGGEIGTILTEEYLKKYPSEDVNPVGTTFATIDVSKVDSLMESLSNLRNDLMGMGASNKEALMNIAVSTHRFDGATDYKDLYDFISKLEKNMDLGFNKSILRDVKTAMKDVIIKNATSESEKDAHGLSIWLPTYDLYYEKNIERYRNLEFNKKTQWADLLDTLFRE